MGPIPAERFRALARSSPWRWHSLRLAVRWHGEHPIWREPVRAWVRRPDGLRVETLAGELVRATQQWPDRSTAILTSDGRGATAETLTPQDPRAPAPELDPDGLVARRPSMWGNVDYDDPMFQSYHWVAMLDPAELADGFDEGRQQQGGPVTMEQLREVDHYGRRAWEAVLRPTDGYDPRCSCCPLLHSLQSDRLDGEASGSGLCGHGSDFQYADAHRVRLDVGTGVCVLTEEIGGSHDGAGHEAIIEAVDEPMADDLFADHSRRRTWRRR